MKRRDFLRLVEEYGAKLDEQSGADFFNVDAPRGFYWVATSCSTIVVQFANSGGQSWKSEAYDQAALDMSDGLEEAGEGAEGWWTDLEVSA